MEHQKLAPVIFALLLLTASIASAGCITERVSRIEVRFQERANCFISTAYASEETIYILHFESGGVFKLKQVSYQKYGPFTPGMTIEICTDRHGYISKIVILRR